MKTRRTFLANCATLAAGAGVMPGGLLSASPARLALVSRFERFAAQQGTTFTIFSASGATFPMRLDQVKSMERLDPAEAGAGDAGNEKYSLLFSGLDSFALGQDTYRFKHRSLGWMEIFIVPVWGPEPNLYVAFFNHPRTLNPGGAS
jgi:hypothetical protein